MSEHEIEFGTLDATGKVTDVRRIKQATVMACPHLIMVPEHYREDGSCRCDDANHNDMADWGYAWKDGRWQ